MSHLYSLERRYHPLLQGVRNTEAHDVTTEAETFSNSKSAFSFDCAGSLRSTASPRVLVVIPARASPPPRGPLLTAGSTHEPLVVEIPAAQTCTNAGTTAMERWGRRLFKLIRPDRLAFGRERHSRARFVEDVHSQRRRRTTPRPAQISSHSFPCVYSSSLLAPSFFWNCSRMRRRAWEGDEIRPGDVTTFAREGGRNERWCKIPYLPPCLELGAHLLRRHLREASHLSLHLVNGLGAPLVNVLE